MHVVHVLTRMLRAGSEENVLLTAAGQMAEGDKVTLVYGADSRTDLADRLAPGAGRIRVQSMVHPIRSVADIAAVREMAGVFREIAPDVVHTHQSKAGIVGRYAARSAKVPCIVHGVHILPFIGVSRGKRAVYITAEKAAARITHGFVHVSEGMRQGYLSNGIGMSVPHEVIRSGFDLEKMRCAELPDDWRALLGVAAGDPKPMTFVMLAALEPRKRHLPLLEILPDVVRTQPDVRFLFAGEGALKNEIAEKARALGIADNVRLSDYRNDPERIIALADACLLASGQEGLPRSVLQYLTAGKPTVLFRLHGIEEVADDSRNALVVPPNDWGKYRDALIGLATNPALRARLSEGARATDLTPWDWRTMGTRTTEFYRRVIDTL